MKNKITTYLIMGAISVLVFGSAGSTIYKGAVSDSSNVKIVERLVGSYTNPDTLRASEPSTSESMPDVTVTPEPSVYELVLCSSDMSFMKTGTSLIQYLKVNGIDTSFKNRAELATHYGMENYRGLASENIFLMESLQKESAALFNCTIEL